jgi:hypothetical protein
MRMVWRSQARIVHFIRAGHHENSLHRGGSVNGLRRRLL